MENRELSPVKDGRSKVLRTPSVSSLSFPPSSSTSFVRSPSNTPLDTSPSTMLSPLPPVATLDQLLIVNNNVPTSGENKVTAANKNKTHQQNRDMQPATVVSLGWQVVTPKKNYKKDKRAEKKAGDLNKHPYSDSPLKERQQKRHASGSTSGFSNVASNPEKKSPCPSPTLSVSALSYSDYESLQSENVQYSMHNLGSS